MPAAAALPSLALVAVLGFVEACSNPSRPSRESAAPPASATPGAETSEPSPPKSEPSTDELVTAEIATIGFDGITDAPVVLLRELSTGRVVPIWVGLAEAQAIARGLAGLKMPRPMTHDLMADLIIKLDAKVEEVRIYDLSEGTYYGSLLLRVEGRAAPLLVDTRPSDGLALALRTGATIRISQSVIAQTPDFQFLAPEADEQVVQALGLTVVAPSPELRRELGLPERKGVAVLVVTGEAAAKGLRRGDLIVEINGTVPETPVDLLDAVRKSPAGRAIRITYLRAGEETTVELVPEMEGPRQIA